MSDSDIQWIEKSQPKGCDFFACPGATRRCPGSSKGYYLLDLFPTLAQHILLLAQELIPTKSHTWES
ncbi:hypothetical protein C4K01_2139 [Pseudomonas synxantha]|nr:hypothetical protein C4K01_2139 [Pseudomonas synxantha]